MIILALLSIVLGSFIVSIGCIGEVNMTSADIPIIIFGDDNREEKEERQDELEHQKEAKEWYGN